VILMANGSSTSATSSRTIRYVHSLALLLTTGLLFRSGMVALSSNLFSFHPNSVAAVWANLDIIAAFLFIPTSLAVLTSLRSATWAAIVLATLAFSAYSAQSLLIFFDRISDQTYLLLNPYLKDSNPVFPLVISFIALMISILRLKTYQAS
jgi:hypothetical protein